MVITLGEQGAIGVTQDGVISSPSFKVQPVDATGAGDTFRGGFSFAYVIQKMSLEKSLIFANACAALKITQLGARTGMPNIEKVSKFLKNRGYPNFINL